MNSTRRAVGSAPGLDGTSAVDASGCGALSAYQGGDATAVVPRPSQLRRLTAPDVAGTFFDRVARQRSDSVNAKGAVAAPTMSSGVLAGLLLRSLLLVLCGSLLLRERPASLPHPRVSIYWPCPQHTR